MKMPKYKRKTLLLAACAPLAVFGLVFMNSTDIFSSQSRSEVIVSDFSAGTHVSYEIFASGKVIDKGARTLGVDGELKLPLPDVQEDRIVELSFAFRIFCRP